MFGKRGKAQGRKSEGKRWRPMGLDNKGKKKKKCRGEKRKCGSEPLGKAAARHVGALRAVADAPHAM